MSGSVVPIKPVLVRDPRLELNNERVYGVLRGGQNVSWQQFQANSVSNSSIQITCNPPSRRHVINRRVYLQVTFSLAFSGMAGSAPILQNEFDGPRAYPLASVITSQTVSLANSTISLGNFNEWWPYLLRYHNDVCSQELDYSCTPSMQDFFQAYGDWQNVGATTTFGYGGAQRNPLAPAGDNSTQMTRAGFSGLTVLTNTTSSGSGNAATATLTVTEPVYMSPFLFARGDEESGFTGIEQCTMTFTLGDLTRIWSHGIANSGPQPFNTPTVSITNAQALFEYLEPSPTETIPPVIAYPFFTVQPSITNSNIAFAYGDQNQLTNLSLQLNGVPRRMYVFARKNINASTYLDSDVAFRLRQLTVQFDSNTYLSNATEQDLYQISRKNGINISWSAWQKYSGSVFCAEFGTDIGMGVQFAPGTIGTHQLVIAGNFQDINQNDTGGTTTTPTLYVIIVYEGVISSVNGSVIQQPNVLTNSDALLAQPMAGVTYKHAETIWGGDFFSGLKSFLGKASNVVGNIAKGVQAVLPVASLVPQLRPFIAPAQGVTDVVRGLTGVGSYGGTYGGASHLRHRMRKAMKMRGVSHRLHGRGFDGADSGSDTEEPQYAEQYAAQYDTGAAAQDCSQSGDEDEKFLSENEVLSETENSCDPVEDYINSQGR